MVSSVLLHRLETFCLLKGVMRSSGAGVKAPSMEVKQPSSHKNYVDPFLFFSVRKLYPRIYRHLCVPFSPFVCICFTVRVRSCAFVCICFCVRVRACVFGLV